jgi:hypothetical protein
MWLFCSVSCKKEENQMTDMTYSHLGSGSIPYTTSIRAGESLSGDQVAQGYRRGVNVLCINPEEYSTSPFFKPSGIVLLADQILPLTGSGVIPFRRSIFVLNNTPGTVLLAYDKANVIDEFAFPIYGGAGKTFPIFAGTDLFVKASGVGIDVRFYEH